MSSSSSFFSGTNPTPTEYQTSVDLVAQATEKAAASLASANSSAASATSSQNYSIAAGNSATSAANQAASAATSATNAATSATSASNSAATATTQATTATNQATTATTQATNSATSASASSASATAAATSATNAASSATAAATSASNAAATLAGAMVKANNLSDVSNVSTARTNLGVAIGSNVQAWDADLDAIAALAGTSGLLKKTAANTWSLDTTSYLSGTVPVANGGTGGTTNTGSGSVVLANSPTLVTPALGTPSSGNLGNCTFPTLNQNTTGTAANITGTLAVAQGGTGATTTTGTGSNVLATSPTLVTPALGTPSSGNLANCTFPTLNQNTTGTAANVTGTVAVGNGGTGLTSLTTGYIPYGNNSGALLSSSALTFTGTVLSISGTSVSSQVSSNLNWNFANLNLIRTGSDVVTPRFIGMPLDGDSLSSTVIGGYNAIWGVYDSAPTTGSTSSALNGGMIYGAYATHRWFINGSERMRIDSSGRVGIGISSPSCVLETQPANNSTQGPLGAAFITLFDRQGNASARRLLITQDTYRPSIQAQSLSAGWIASDLLLNVDGGNVGIGINGAPAQKLDVGGNIKASGATGSFIGFADATSHCMKYDTTLNGIKLNGYGAVVFETAGANERMRIDSSGNVGIGTSSPSTYGKLSVFVTPPTGGADGIYIPSSVTQLNSVVTGATYSFSGVGASQGWIYTTASDLNIGPYGSHNIKFIANNSERMRIDNAGRVGINRTNPQALLDIALSAANQTGLRISNTSGTNNYSEILFAIGTTSASSGYSSYIRSISQYSTDYSSVLTFGTSSSSTGAPQERLRIDSSGRVGIGSTPNASTIGLTLGGTATGGTVIFQQYLNYNVASDVTSYNRGIVTNIGTNAAAFTLGNLEHFYAGQGTLGAGSAITNQIGYRAASNIIGATYNYGFYGDIPSGTNRWNFYAAGTAQNYFAGNICAGNYLYIGGTDSTTNPMIQAQSGYGLTLNAYNASGFITLNTGGSERMRIDSSGNVGINQSAPNSLLCVGTTTGAASAPTYVGRVRIGPAASQSLAATGGLEFVSAGGVSGYGWRISGIDLGAGSVPFVFETRQNSTSWTELVRISESGNVGIGTIGPTSLLTVAGPVSLQQPSTKTANYSLTATDSSLIFNGSGSITLTLQAASSYPGRILYVKTIAAQTVVSASSNVVPVGSSTAGTAILAATAGKWAMLQSDGTNWVTMMAN